MKRVMLLAFVIMISAMSCNTEELFIEPVEEEVINLEDEEEVLEEDTDPGVDASLPCDFDLNTIAPNATILINCIMDLDGATIDLPANVSILYEGGDIINGTFIFSDNTIISGELLNSTLILGGSTPQLKDPTFELIPSRWGIVEGVVSDDIALNNTNVLEQIFFDTKSFGVITFNINSLDAFFKVDGPLNEGVPNVHAINIPSDFNLVMTENTHLRMQPNGHFRANLLTVLNEKNITITGGNLHGEREQHNYNSGYVDSDGSTGITHEWLNTLAIVGGKNIVIDGVSFIDPAGDGLIISGVDHYFSPNHVSSENIQVINNKFLRARRTNLVLVGGTNILIENNEFIDGGIDMANSKGAAPSSDFNSEPVRTRDTNGGLIEWERVDNVIIRNNFQTLTDAAANPSAGGFYFSHGNGPIIFEDNEVNSGVSFTTVDGLIIRNNIINGQVIAGSADNTNRTDFVFGNEIYGNKISNGVIIAGNGVTLRDNEIEGEFGIYMGPGTADVTKGVSNSLIKNNIIKASNYGIYTLNSITNTTIEGNSIEMLPNSLFAFYLNSTGIGTETEANFIVKDNIVTGSKETISGAHATVIRANSISVTNNSFGCVQIVGGSNNTFKGNKIEAEYYKEGLLLNSDCPNSEFTDNEITYYTSIASWVSCITIKEGLQLSNSVIIENNSCIEK